MRRTFSTTRQLTVFERNIFVCLVAVTFAAALGLILRVLLFPNYVLFGPREHFDVRSVVSAERTESGNFNDSNIISMNGEDLIIEDLSEGEGLGAETGDVVVVHYTGTFQSGEEFDSSRRAGRDPFQFTLGAGHVISGWDEGVVGMKVGGKRRLIVPPELGYGPEDYGPIPGGSTLIFEIELLSIFER